MQETVTAEKNVIQLALELCIPLLDVNFGERLFQWKVTNFYLRKIASVAVN